MVRRPDTGLAAGVLGVAVAAWVLLLAWAQSPYGRYLEHGDWRATGLSAEICRVLPGGDWLLPLLIHAGAWVLMTVAMMLPTILPLLRIFARMTAARADGRRLLQVVALGYLLAWSAFGILAHGADLAVHWAAASSPWLDSHAAVVGAAVLMGAGLFQFSALKYQCLDRCRAPVGFVVAHWGQRRDALQALRLGVDHGVFCVGCCWALMLLMFVVGTGSLAWMFGLAVLMAVEKNARWGRHLSRPLGVALVLLGMLFLTGISL